MYPVTYGKKLHVPMRLSLILLLICLCSSSIFASNTSSKTRVDQIIETYHSVTYQKQISYLEALAGMGILAKKSIPLLTTALQSPHEKIRENALVALEQMGPDALVALVGVEKCLNDQELVLAAQAAQTIAAIGPGAKRTQTQLLIRANSFGNYMLESSLKALGGIKADFEKVKPLLLLAYSSKNADVRRQAIMTTGQLDAQGAWSIIYLESLSTDPSKWVRASVYDALALFPEEIIPVVALLIKGLDDTDYYVRIRAAQALATLGKRAHQAALPVALRLNDPSPRVQIELAKALLSMGNSASAVRQKVVNASKNADGALKKILLQAIKKM